MTIGSLEFKWPIILCKKGKANILWLKKTSKNPFACTMSTLIIAHYWDLSGWMSIS